MRGVRSSIFILTAGALIACSSVALEMRFAPGQRIRQACLNALEDRDRSYDYALRRTIGQPKRVHGAYAAQHGLLVPTQFLSLAEAIQSGGPVIIRSEHPLEYAGPSGIWDSYVLSHQELKKLWNELVIWAEQNGFSNHPRE